ncbi:MAG: hypothetical protein JXR64_09895 [Spirochaetales bacterium]|nr:hypothetical protein [Spirochaetales bacterium]
MDLEVDYKKYLEAVEKHSRVFFVLISHIMEKGYEGNFSQLFLARLKVEAGHLEDFLDYYGCLHNKQWFPVREAVAVVKSFSGCCFKCTRLIEQLPKKKILADETEFKYDINEAYNLLKKALYNSGLNAITQFKKVNIVFNVCPIECSFYNDYPDLGYLERNRKKRSIKTAEQAAVSLATSFLNIAEDFSQLKKIVKTKKSDYLSMIPDVFDEAKLMQFENKFHSLQSLFDTYLSESIKLNSDKTLPGLKCYISVIYHLLDISTKCSHYIERHATFLKPTLFNSVIPPASDIDIVTIIIDIFIRYALELSDKAQRLCKETLLNYEKRGKIRVRIPNYRGFHVRPSTLIAKIVIHYGTEIKMIMDDKTYNAAIPLELFRANEVINAQKRFMINKVVNNMDFIKKKNALPLDSLQLKTALRNVYMDLMENEDITLYNKSFSFEDLPPIHGEKISSYAKRAITHHLATGTLDIKSDQMVFFEGDVRVLEDIKILAENGYGEDKFGNNIVLPKELSYLRR